MAEIDNMGIRIKIPIPEQLNIAATELEFEKAAEIRDRIKELKKAFSLK